MQTELETIGQDRVRLTVEVPTHSLEHAVEHALSDLGASVRIPGFRKGKVPPAVLVSRLGRERIYGEAVESHIGGWYRAAVASARIHPVEAPEYDYELPGSTEETFRFTATVGVQPKPKLAEWRGLEVPGREPELSAEAVDRELERLRTAVAELAPVENRGARDGDALVLDIQNEDSGDVERDFVVELGEGRLVPEIEAALAGMEPGQRKDASYAVPDGSRQTVAITLKELKERVLPPLDDELARAASEFETLAELRADIEGRLRRQLEEELEGEFRAAAVDALVEASRFEPAGPLVDRRAAELWTGFLRSLERRGVSPETYLRLTNQSVEELQGRMVEEARRAVAREIVLEALADELGLEVGDEELRDFVREQAAETGEDAEEAIEAIWHSGRHEDLRDDLRLRTALDRLVSEAKRIDPELARAREKLWTPGQEKGPADTKLWTPGSKERV